MLSHRSQIRVLLPVALTGTVSFALCAAAAVFMVREQAATAAALGENIVRQRAVGDLEESLADLVALLRDRVEGVSALHDRVRLHLADLRRTADQPAERQAAADLEASFRRYLAVWRSLPDRTGPEHDQARRDAMRVLEAETLPRCQELRALNARRIDESERRHQATVRGLAWGLAVVGATAAVAGLALGYGAARGLRRSIQRLQVRVRDAAGKLDPAAPTIELTEEGNLGQLDAQVQALIGQVERVVAALQQREREVLRAEQLAAVGQLATGVAHEIRNPLASIKMLVQAGRDADAPGLPPEDLAVIEREIRRMERSLQGFLDFARPPRPHKVRTDLARVVEQTLQLVRGRADRQRVELAFDHPADPVELDADAGQIHQVLVNLALNALDAMPTGGRLTVALARRDGRAELAVTDTGPGVAPEMQSRLFRPFASSKPTGLGMGLVISRRIVEDHGGAIWAEDHPGGACFVVRLPLVVRGP